MTNDVIDKMTDAERLARAVLLFHRGGEWTAWDTEVWSLLTGSSEATTKILCNFARRVLQKEEQVEQGETRRN